MPRPGPRPYECVRRAWHSDRHQPMRGSLIQEIFRVVNEIHSSATRKNKEWQNKLPIVVLKAEEIMYSKANSEAEYLDLETLWERVNDAINTIIRLDESTETGVFLQPCIEAALNLGCTPRRTPRSQRNNTSTYYLNINTTNPNCFPSNNLHKTAQEAPMTINPFVNIKNPNNINLSPFNLKSPIPFLKTDNSLVNNFSFPPLPSNGNKAPSVYPLYYGKDIQIKGQKCDFDAPSKPYCDFNEIHDMGFVQNLIPNNPKSKNEETRANLAYKSEENSYELECDLSLRLGPSSTTQNVGKFDNLTNSLLRKRKAVVSNSPEDLRHCWQPKVSSSNSNGGRPRNGGL